MSFVTFVSVPMIIAFVFVLFFAFVIFVTFFMGVLVTFYMGVLVTFVSVLVTVVGVLVTVIGVLVTVIGVLVTMVGMVFSRGLIRFYFCRNNTTLRLEAVTNAINLCDFLITKAVTYWSVQVSIGSAYFDFFEWNALGSYKGLSGFITNGAFHLFCSS